jgi:Protein of unknown function (DUF3460)
MPIFFKPYHSEITQFIKQLKADKPELEAQQRAGRALLWDKPLDLDATHDNAQSRVPQMPYVYGTSSSKTTQK